jgi:hypothetical protein
MKMSQLFGFACLLVLASLVNGCATGGARHHAEYVDPSGKAEYDYKTVRGQPVTEVKVKSNVHGAAMSQAGVSMHPMGRHYGPLVGPYASYDDTATPWPLELKCVEVVSGKDVGTIICPRIHGVVPMVEQSTPVHNDDNGYCDATCQQAAYNAAALQQLQECIANNTCQPVR